MEFGIGCCCSPNCFGGNQILKTTATLTASGFDWALPEDLTQTEGGLVGGAVSFGGGFVFVGHTIHHTLTRPFSLLNGTKKLWINPNGSCQWLFADAKGVSSVYRPGHTNNPAALDPEPTRDSFLEEKIFTPLNKTDPLSPWHRVYARNDDGRCPWNTSGSNVSCKRGANFSPENNPEDCVTAINGSDSGPLISAMLEVTTPVQNGPKYWTLTITNLIARSAISNSSLSFGIPTLNAFGFLMQGVGAVGDPIQITAAHRLRSYGVGINELPPYRFSYGGTMLKYRKLVEPSTDFRGDPIVLTVVPIVQYDGLLGDYFEVTYPETVEITY